MMLSFLASAPTSADFLRLILQVFKYVCYATCLKKHIKVTSCSDSPRVIINSPFLMSPAVS